jgi:peptide/nickel transport system permease protein
MWLLLYATVIAVGISVPLAAAAAAHKNKAIDHLVRLIPLVGLGMPAFWIGILFLLAFALTLHIFPVGGYGSGFFGHLRSMFLPALTISVSLTPLLVRSLRASLLTILDADHVVTARAKGLSYQRVLIRHVVRNAVMPTVTVLAINLGFLVGGTVVVEQVFGIPGLGSLMINAILTRDFPVVQGVTLTFAVLVVAINLLADLSYLLLDPRVKFD